MLPSSFVCLVRDLIYDHRPHLMILSMPLLTPSIYSWPIKSASVCQLLDVLWSCSALGEIGSGSKILHHLSEILLTYRGRRGNASRCNGKQPCLQAVYFLSLSPVIPAWHQHDLACLPFWLNWSQLILSCKHALIYPLLVSMSDAQMSHPQRLLHVVADCVASAC